VEQKLDFLWREYFCLAVPFYLHLCVYSTRYQKVCHKYCITAWVGVFGAIGSQRPRGEIRGARFGEKQEQSR
jgi:hypothetical protein